MLDSTMPKGVQQFPAMEVIIFKIRAAIPRRMGEFSQPRLTAEFFMSYIQAPSLTTPHVHLMDVEVSQPCEQVAPKRPAAWAPLEPCLAHGDTPKLGTGFYVKQKRLQCCGEGELYFIMNFFYFIRK